MFSATRFVCQGHQSRCRGWNCCHKFSTVLCIKTSVQLTNDSLRAPQLPISQRPLPTSKTSECLNQKTPRATTTHRAFPCRLFGSLSGHRRPHLFAQRMSPPPPPAKKDHPEPTFMLSEWWGRKLLLPGHPGAATFRTSGRNQDP